MSILVYIFFLHFVADFVLQPYSMKIQKSRQSSVMLMHIFIYVVVLFVGLAIFIDPFISACYSLINGTIHLLVDWASSRVISGSSKDIVINPGHGPLYERAELYAPIVFFRYRSIITSHFFDCYVVLFYIFTTIKIKISQKKSVAFANQNVSNTKLIFKSLVKIRRNVYERF